jgi:FlaA1/EpsC-like NDP-sugar epimerase
MVLILNRYRFFLRLSIYTLPLMAFTVAGALLPGFPYQLYQSPVYILLISTTLAVWGMAAEHYQVCSVDELLREWSGIRRAFPACITTYLIVIAIGFFLHDLGVSRAVLLLSAVLLFADTLIVRGVFRSLVRRGIRARKPLRVLIVGTTYSPTGQSIGSAIHRFAARSWVTFMFPINPSRSATLPFTNWPTWNASISPG